MKYLYLIFYFLVLNHFKNETLENICNAILLGNHMGKILLLVNLSLLNISIIMK